MITQLLNFIGSTIVSVIAAGGYWGILVLMTLESAAIPVPSEVIMPFSGYLITMGKLAFWPVVFWASMGNLIGSLIAYGVGFLGGRPFLNRWGKYVLISRKDLDKTDAIFEKYGAVAVFFGRLLPVIRTFISLPAGVARMNLGRFIFYSFAGSLPWNAALAYLGIKLGSHWKNLGVYFHKFDVLVVVIVLVAIIWWVKRHFKHNV